MKMVNKAVDQIRKDEQKEIYLVKKENNLKGHQKDELVILKDMNLKTGKANQLKLALQDLWTIPGLLTDVYPHEWMNWAVRSRGR